jgi:hypothetical protein
VKIRSRVVIQAFMAAVWLSLAATMLMRHRVLPGLLALGLGLVHAGVTYLRLRVKKRQTTHPFQG